MKGQLYTTKNASETLLPLQQLVANLVNSFLSTARRNQTQVVNEVRQEIALGASTQSVIAIMSELLSTVVSNSRNGDIHITAEKFSNIITLQIQERNNYNGYALAFSIASIEATAHSMGGHIRINGTQKRVATVSFSFPDQIAAA